MDGRTIPFSGEQEDYENSPENSSDSPPSGLLSDSKIASTSSPRRRRGVEKRVVSVPIKDVEGSRLKGDMSTPPSDSWAWRKYGQKPIKGSPYPRGYYRCSSSKGCPARKQVERSRADPTMVLVTYSCEHNHSSPASKNNRNRNQNSNQNQNQDNNSIATTATITTVAVSTPIVTTSNSEDDQNATVFAMDEEFCNLEGSLNTEYTWFTSFEASSTMLESPILASDVIGESDIATIFSSNEEDEALFADLGELPECSLVFRRGVIEREEERRTPIYGTTG